MAPLNLFYIFGGFGISQGCFEYSSFEYKYEYEYLPYEYEYISYEYEYEYEYNTHN